MGKDRILDITDKKKRLRDFSIDSLFVLLIILFITSCSFPRFIVLEDPLTPEEHINLGLSYEKEGLLENAIDEYTKASKKLPIAYLYLGNIYMQKNDFDQAERYYKKAIKKQDIADAYNNLAWLYYIKRENLDEAERLILKALELNPENENYKDTLHKIRGMKKNKL
jgi:tetratricopeptide (TPR) repeat protein